MDIPVGPLLEALESLTGACTALDRVAATQSREGFEPLHDARKQAGSLIEALGQIIEANTWTDRFLTYSGTRGLMILLKLNDSKQLVEWLLKKRGEQWDADMNGGLRKT